MLSAYLAVKGIHQTCALITFCLFVYRGAWIFTHLGIDRPRWMKILPHIIDSLLLASAIALVLITSQYPGEQAWLNAKILALVAYIGLGLYAFRFAKNRLAALAAWLLGIGVFIYIAAVAFTRFPAVLALAGL